MPTQAHSPSLTQATAWQALCRKFSPDAASIAPLVLLLLLGHLLLWTVLSGLSHHAPDWDNMEELVWASTLEWGYYKHPPLPSWLLHGLVSLFDRPVWLTFFTGQLSVVLSLWFVWRLGCEMTTPRRALIATLLVSTITYFTVRGVMNNHNTIQLWSIAAAIWMFYRAVRHHSMRAWAALGVFSGFALLTKYSAVIQFAAFFTYLLLTGRLMQARIWQGIALACAILLTMLAPHLWWLAHQTAGPLSYASHSLVPKASHLEHMRVLYDFLLTNAGRLVPMGFSLLLVMFLGARKNKPGQPPETKGATLAGELSAEDRFFLLIVGLGPLVLTLIGSALLKAPLAAPWATTFFMLFGFYVFWRLRAGDDVQLLRKVIVVVVSLQILMALGYALARGPFADMTGRATRANFPGAAISRQLHAEWRSHVKDPLKVVAADTWLGGNIATHIGREVDVLIDGELNNSPWLKPSDVIACGMLVAVNRSPDNADGTSTAVLALLAQASWSGTLQLPWTSKIGGPQVVVDWGIIPPQGGCSAAGH